ncbi:MAG: hypothetical protein IH940_05200 [Acidobacteria bacterium]|nr:hypothetical protein [Acidobacteriota bacterium]
MSDYDIEFHWDPICPFAWITSRWVNQVVAQRNYRVDWRFISLRLLNKDKDYATDFPPEYPQLHGAGLRMLRVAASVRTEHGRDTMGPLYTALGERLWDTPPSQGVANTAMTDSGTDELVSSVLSSLDLPATHVGAADDTSWDEELTAETEHALARTGRDVGTPIISFEPPDGPSFFGPVISRLPSDDEAVELWDAIITLSRWAGFAELKRSLREVPQLAALGYNDDDESIVEQDWKGGRRVS